ncbi:SAM-dependent methyltransferase [Streptacidiphilus sp. MAP12-16]|uniref:class I SAM-dependent methyltransferase n=1 Tax=Streptacidiphilus sp. MAP12-16 TaxID=3156300 RepID=UPI003515591D
MTTTDTPHYSFDTGSEHAATQMSYLSEILDGTTRRHLRQAGELAGARCLDIGAGAGSVSAWLAQAVGPDGHVTATDLDPRHLDHLRSTATVLRHDVRTDPLPDASFDLIHARLVLMHLPERVGVLQKLVRALRPGGRLVLTEWQCAVDGLVLQSPGPDQTALFTRHATALLRHVAGNGADFGWATRVLATMHSAGLTELVTHTDARSWPGGTAGAMLHHCNSYHLAPGLLAAGLTKSDLEGVRPLLTNPDFVINGWLTHTTIGRAAPEL